ncbi:MAG: hypothetical protein ACXAC7_08775 [Candidatus Hodarchaeales archaeon]|jgi:hypothetical protein
MKYVDLILKILIIFSLFIIINPQLGQATSDFIDTNTQELAVEGSLLNPGFVYVPSTSIFSHQPHSFGLTNGDEPTYISSVFYSGSNPYYRTNYIPPNYNNPINVGSRSFGQSLFNNPFSSNEQSAGFLKVGPILPTSQEREALTNYSYWSNPWYNYPWNDRPSFSANASANGIVGLKLTQNNATLKANQWSSFDVNESFPLTIAFEPTHAGINIIYLAQYFGDVRWSLFKSDGTVINSGSLYNRDSYLNYFVLTDLDNGIVYLSLAADEMSEVHVRIDETSNLNPTKLEFNKPKDESFELTEGDKPIIYDDINYFVHLEIKAFEFEVPADLDGKFFMFNFLFRSDYHISPYIFSDNNEQSYTNTPIYGHSGEKWTVLFNVYDLDSYNYYLNVIPSDLPVMSLNTDTSMIFPEEASPSYKYKVVISSSGLYRLSFTANTMEQGPEYGNEADLRWLFIDFNYLNGTAVSSYVDMDYNEIIFLPKGELLINIYENSFSAINAIVSLQTINTLPSPVERVMNKLSSQYIHFVNPSADRDYEVTVALLSEDMEVEFNVYIYNELAQTIDTQNIILNSLLTVPINVTHTYASNNWGSKFYIYLVCINVNDLSPDLREFAEVRITITDSGSVSSDDETSLSVTPASSGHVTLEAGFSEYVTINMANLPTKTWVRVEMDFEEANPIFSYSIDLKQFPTINTRSSPYSFNDLTVRSNGNHQYVTLGFGSMNTTGTLEIFTQTFVDGKITVKLLPQTTQNLGFNYPQLGNPSPKASSAPIIKGEVGAEGIPSFLFLSTIGGIILIVLTTVVQRKRF